MTSERPALFIDTWAWLVLADEREPAHAEVRALRKDYANRRAGWVTSDYVLSETITRVFSRRPFDDARTYCDSILKARDLGFLQVETITPERSREAYRMRTRLDDKPRISFTDLTSMCVMRDRGLRHIVTKDSHFLQAGLGFLTLP
jgi:predicted nucleic acid-binding protein